MELNDIEQLLTSYFEGNTSLHEEEKLKQYFTGQKVASHLLQYKPIFVGFSAAQKLGSERSFTFKKEKKKSLSFWKFAMAESLLMAFVIGGYYMTLPPRLTQEEKEALMAFEHSKKAMLMLSENLNKGTQQIRYVNQFEEAKDKFWKKNPE